MPIQPTSIPPSKRERLVDIDHLKAVAIALVVYGHIVAREPPARNEWYVVSKDTLYLFHMPLFMFVSGLIMAYTYQPAASVQDYFSYVSKRIARLLPAYVILSVAIVFGKLLASRTVHVDNVPSGPSELLFVFTRPYASAAAFLWYVYALLLYTITFPLWLLLVGRRTALLLPIGLALFIAPRSNAFGLGQYAEYFVFFSAGIVAVRHLDALRSIADRWLGAWIALFAVGLTVGAYRLSVGYPPDWQNRLWMLSLGSVAIPLFLGLVRLRFIEGRTTLNLLATYTFTIYLFNTIFIGVFKGLLTKVLPWDGVNFLLYLPMLWVVGLAAPILLYRAFLSRVPWVRKVFI